MNPMVISALIGAVAGILAGLCGVGGGVFMVPAFALLLNMGQKTAVATSLAVVILTSLVATVKNANNQLVDWKIVASTAVVSALVAWFAADWLKKLSNLSLTRIFAVFMILIGLYMLFRSFGPQPSSRVSPILVKTPPPPSLKE
jgi:uncharacterized membrane protein YfcA